MPSKLKKIPNPPENKQFQIAAVIVKFDLKWTLTIINIEEQIGLISDFRFRCIT